MADSGEAQQSEQVCNFFRKPLKNKNIRKRTIEEDEDEDQESKNESFLSQNQKKAPKSDNKLYFSTGSSKSTASVESNEESVRPMFQFDSSKEIQVQNDSRATAILETETDFSRDARAIREKALKRAEEALKGKSKSSGDEKLYKGIHGYTDHKAGFRREQTISSEKAGGAHGPLRASAHIRVSARFDYQPDICKDYKETGYCGYGDSCKFMHDRGDYKSGWQLEKEWEEAEKVRKRNLALRALEEDEGDIGQGGDEDDDDDSLPFACLICRKPFQDPVVTKCKHYFCEHCALKHHSTNKKCFVCNQPTLGIFNAAHEIRKKMAEAEEDHVGARSRKRISKTQARSSHTFRSSRRSKCKLDTKLFESHLENLWSTFSQAKKVIFTYMDSLWFAMYTNVSSRPKVLGWIKNKRIFSKKYVLVPIVRWGHWSLLIFCHFGDALQSENATPCMLLLDSLNMANPKRLEPEIRRFVLDIYKSEGRAENKQLVSRIPLLVPKVPQQRNDEECGNYVLYFIYLFVLDAPENFSTKGYPYFMNENWFTPESVDDFCKKLQSSRSDVENCP